MKRFITLSILAVVATAFFSSCNSGIKTPEEIGKKAFEILKNFEKSSKQDFVDNFMTIEEIHKLAEDEKEITDAEMKEEISSITQKGWNEQIEYQYEDLKEDIKYIKQNNKIILKDIEFVNYEYEIENEGGLNVCEGTLYFKYNDTTYEMDIVAVYNGKSYKFIKMYRLYW
jgi:hypothetical protein